MPLGPQFKLRWYIRLLHMNSYSIKCHPAFWKNSQNLGAGKHFYPSGEVLKLFVLQHISEVGWSDCHYIQVSTRKCYCTVERKRIYPVWGFECRKAPMWFGYIFCILNYLRTYKLLCTPVWVFHIIYFYCVNEYRLQLAFSSLKSLQKFQWSDNTSEYGLQRKYICFDKLLFLNPNQNFIEFIMKSHWWILEVGCNAILMSSPQIHRPYIIGGYRHWIIYKWNY